MTRYLFLLGLACAQPVDLSMKDSVSEELATREVNDCALQFAPTPDIEVQVQDALNRWSAATGCDLSISPQGIPIESHPFLWAESLTNGSTLVGEFPWENSRNVCGLSAWQEETSSYYYIDVALNCDVDYAIAHEIGHVLSNNPGHSLSGVLAEGKDPRAKNIIDEPSLSYVCQNLACTKFQPEN